MSLNDAKRMLQWNVIMEALADTGVDAEFGGWTSKTLFVKGTGHASHHVARR